MDPVRVEEAEQSVAGVAAAITVTAQVSSNRSIVLQTYLPRDATISEYHAVLDKFGAAVDRQEAKEQLEAMQVDQALEERTLKSMEEDFTALPERLQAQWEASSKRGPYKQSPAELAQRGQAEVGIRRYRESIAKRAVEIGKCEAVIAKVE